MHLAKSTYRLFSEIPVLSVQSSRDKLAAILMDLGVGYLPFDDVKPYLASGQLVNINIVGVDEVVQPYLAWRRGETGKALRWFIDQFAEPDEM